jgi:DNA-binding transcriptional LysR family regulator
MELWQLKYFLAVADELNYGRAAARLNVTQPAVTRAVQGLENELEVTLFLRDKRRVELTPAGRVFADEARGVLAGLETSARQARRVERGEVGTLTIGFEGLSTFTFIPRAVQAFQARYPDVSIDLLEMSATELAAALKDHRIELGFVVPPIDDPVIAVEVVGSESLAMPAAHRLARQPTVKIADLAGERHIGSSTLCGTNRPMIVALRAAGVEPPVARVSDMQLRLGRTGPDAGAGLGRGADAGRDQLPAPPAAGACRVGHRAPERCPSRCRARALRRGCAPCMSGARFETPGDRRREMKPPQVTARWPISRFGNRSLPSMARLRPADCIEQCPSSRVSGKHMLVLSSSQFDR